MAANFHLFNSGKGFFSGEKEKFLLNLYIAFSTPSGSSENQSKKFQWHPMLSEAKRELYLRSKKKEKKLFVGGRKLKKGKLRKNFLSQDKIKHRISFSMDSKTVSICSFVSWCVIYLSIFPTRSFPSFSLWQISRYGNSLKRNEGFVNGTVIFHIDKFHFASFSKALSEKRLGKAIHQHAKQLIKLLYWIFFAIPLNVYYFLS